MSTDTRKPSASLILELADPKWNEAGKVHDWRNHVGENTRKVWNELSAQAQYAVFRDAQIQADTEEWE